MIDENNIFLATTTYLQLSDDQKDDLHQIYLNAQAINFYLISTLRKCIREMTPDFHQRRVLIKCYFNRLQEAVNCQKKQKLIVLFKVAALSKIAKYRQKKVEERQKQKFVQEKMRLYRNRSILKEWKKVIAIDRTIKQFEKTKKKDMLIEFISFLRENRQSNLYKALQINNQLSNLKSLYTKKILRLAFQSMIIHRKMVLLNRSLVRNYFKQFKKHARIAIAQQKKKTASFRRKFLLSKVFSSWKASFHEVVAQQYHYRSLIARYFDYWRSNLDIIASERQIQKHNQCIADIYLQRIAIKKIKRVIQSWKEWVIDLKENRQTNLIISTYAEKKRKQVLLSRYFQMLRQNCINNKIKIKYYGIKLKRKVIDSLKLFFRQSVYREEKIIEFMEKRLIKQYFKKWVIYNQTEQKKVNKFRKAKYFKAFTESIIAQYYLQNELSLHFYQTNLLYKVLFALKKQKTFRQKEQYIIGLVNVVLPLRRWLKVFRIRKFQKDRLWFQKKDIFREWKLMMIRRNSEDMAVRQFRETSIKKNGMAASLSKMEEQFQFSNILSTIAKIRNNLQAERQETIHQRSKHRMGLNSSQSGAETPSESIDYSLSLDYA